MFTDFWGREHFFATGIYEIAIVHVSIYNVTLSLFNATISECSFNLFLSFLDNPILKYVISISYHRRKT